MTLGNQAESAMAAYNKRKAQLDRWRESDTERESIDIRNRPKRVKFADKCIFQAACASNDKGQVAKMIQEGYDINAVDEDGITALHQACIEDNFDMVEFLLANGADVNISDNEGWTPLHAVATCCYVSIAKLLLEHGANVVALNNDCSIPLDICKSDEIRELFIQDINGKGIDLKEARRGEELKMMEDAKKWLENGYYEEEPHPTTGATAMHVAACKGYIKVLDVLVKAGASINCKDFDGWTPLHAAAHWGQKEACEVLLENMCDMNIKNNCDQSAIDVADASVIPVLEDFKKKHDVNKNIENQKPPNVLPLPPKKKSPRPVFDEDVTIVTNPLGPNQNKPLEGSYSGSAPLDERINDRVTVRRTRSEATAENTPLRRAYSFEHDSKFYTRLRDARNRIKAIEAAAANVHLPPTSNLNTTSTTDTTILTTASTNHNNSISPTPNSINSPEVILRRKDSDSARSPRPNTIGSSSPQNRSVGNIANNNAVQMRRSFVPPARDEESETQRKAHAKRVRETRRSTQGVTLEELKSAEQYVKNSQQSNPGVVTSNDQINAPSGSTVPANVSTVLRKEEDLSLERRPSWRLRVDDQDRSKFSLEDTRSTSTRAGVITDNISVSQRSPSLRNKAGKPGGESPLGKPPRPPEDDREKAPGDDDKDKDMKNSGAQGAILRKKKQKRRSTGVVQFNADGTEPDRQDSQPSDNEVGSGRGSGFSSDVEQGPESSKSENGVTTRINYRKLYEEVLKENQMLKSRLSRTEEEMSDLKLKLEKVALTQRIGVDDAEKREKRALERKLSEMEEELKETRHLRSENQKLRDENGALIRVISKLSK